MMTFDQFLEELAVAVAGATPDQVAGAVLVITGIIASIAVISLLGYLLTAIGFAKIFKKAGEKGWKAFIPIFNVYTRFKIAWNTKFFWIWLLIMVITSIVPILGDGVIISLISLVASLIGVGCIIKLYLKFSAAFGKGAGTAVLLFFFPFIMSLVLGFGKAEYIGNRIAFKE